MTQIAAFSIERLEYLSPQGEALGELPAFAKNRDILVNLYRTMVLNRTFDKKAIALQRTGKMGTYASTLGMEAIGTAIGAALKPEDVLVPFYRDYAAQIQRGTEMTDIYRYWGGDERGSANPHSKQDMPISVPIASQCLHASGIATAFKLRNEARVALVTCGDGGTSEGDFYEAINVAGAWQLPVVFVVNNNQWAISVPLSKQTRCQTIAQKAIAAGIDSLQVDGNDIIAVFDAVSRAIENARHHHKPTLIEATTYRLCDHTTADDASRYRPQAEVDEAWALEPISRLQKYLTAQGWWDESAEQAWQTDCQGQVEQAVERYLATPPAPVSDMFDYHFANMPASLLEQRADALEEETWGA
jgi:2-oxoisovalerate dehydrogenase E1 component alpha subunit